MLCGAVLCCAVLCCAVLCCAVLCCVVLCCAVLLCCVVFSWAILCCAVLRCVGLYCAVLCCDVLGYTVLCCVVLCCVVLCCVLLHAPNPSTSNPHTTTSTLPEFRFLNGPSITIGHPTSPSSEQADFTRLMNKLDESPDGGTPLCRHVREIIQKILPMAPQLRASGQKVALIIATDGEPSDGEGWWAFVWFS